MYRNSYVFDAPHQTSVNNPIMKISKVPKLPSLINPIIRGKIGKPLNTS